MPETDRPSTLQECCVGWELAFDRIGDEIGASGRRFDEALAAGDSEDAYLTALAKLSGVKGHGDRAMAALAHLTKRMEDLYAEWRAARRYEPDVLAGRIEELATSLAGESALVAKEWLSELFDAIDAQEWRAVDQLAGSALPWPQALAPGADAVEQAVVRWREGDHAAGGELMAALGSASLGGWDGVLTRELRGRAYRLAAWISLRRLKDPKSAERHLDAAIELWPYAGRMHAERAAYFLSIGDLDLAAADAQRAVELAHDDAAGYLELGIWAELCGDFEDADEFYRKSLALMPLIDVARLDRRASLMDPPGRMLTRAAEILLAKRRPRDALGMAEHALHADQRGPELHPQVAALDVRAEALEQLKDHSDSEAAVAALEAGKLHARNGDATRAIERFERALALDADAPDAGWLLADVRLTTSLPRGATLTDQTTVAAAREQWERWAEKVGPPHGTTSWAYITRAMIADLGTQTPEADRLAGVWEALLYVEKAIHHDDVDAMRWGCAAQYLRYLHLDELAFEAAERGYELGAGDRQVLTERLAQLMYRGRFGEAEILARQLVAMFGNDPWVSAARAWLAIHSRRKSRFADGLELLELPIAGGNDPSWYYEMRALCHCGQGHVEAAHSACAAMLRDALEVDGTTKSRLQVAAIAVGDVERADRLSREAADDPTSRPTTRLTADAFAALARGELDIAVDRLTDATEVAMSSTELRDVCDMTLLRLPLLDGDRDACERAVAEVAGEPTAMRRRRLEESPPDADQEHAAALAAAEEHAAAPPVIRTALLAVDARRRLHRGDLRAAEASYQALLGTEFEPEATMGLSRVLRSQARKQAAAGDVELVRQLTERLTALGNVSRADAATTVASALERVGSRSDAREQLVSAIGGAATHREQASLHQRAGRLALADDDLDEASEHFQAALDIATRDGWLGRQGQLQIRMALVAVLRGDRAAIHEHLLAAARAWKEGGALDPAEALLGELHGLARLRGERWQQAAGEATALVEEALAPRGTEPELEPLRRELGLA